ncbi:hypothetical protein [Halobacteriovorax sp. JY17]|nr:hypothetical protein [Halobacteriovorax sp. JY17]
MSEQKIEIEISDDMEKEFEEMAERKLEKYSEQLACSKRSSGED